MPINKVPTATITQYNEVLNQQTGELQITGKDGALDLSQTLRVTPPAIVAYDESTKNFRTFQLGEWQNGLKLVSIVESIT